MDGSLIPKGLPEHPPWARDRPAEGPPDLGARTLRAVRSIWRMRNVRVGQEAAHFEFLHRTEGYRKFGFGSFGDFARELLQTSRRSARRRVDLHATLTAAPEFADAFNAGRVSACQVLALRPALSRGSPARWLELAATCTVREIREHVADCLGRGVEDAEDSAWQRVTFAAPAAAAIAWDQGIECARRVLGETEAPAYFCVEAMVAEAGAELEGLDAPVDATLGASPSLESSNEKAIGLDGKGAGGVDSREFAEPLAADRARLCESIRLAAAQLEGLGPGEYEEPHDARASFRWLRDMRHVDRKLRLWLVRLLRDADRAGVLKGLGYGSINAFLIGELKISERSAQRMMSAAWLFEDNPALVKAFAAGRIGLGQAFMVDRVARPATLEAFIARSEFTTHLEFEREVRFLERLAEFTPGIARAFPGPLPHPELESALRSCLRERGWSEARIEAAVLGRMPKLARHAIERDRGSDAASLRRLEVLLEIVALAEEGDCRIDEEVIVPPTLPTAPRWTTVSFWAPRDLVERWTRAIQAIRVRSGPLPSWAAAILILEHAVNEWERVDPARRPEQTPIFERDEWRCQAPGCSARRRLEAHHIIFKSAGGTDDPENLITLCHAHHRHGIHENRLKVTGKAPWNLKWRMGSPGYRWEWPRPANQNVILADPS